MISDRTELEQELKRLGVDQVQITGRMYTRATLPWLQETSQWCKDNKYEWQKGVGDCFAAAINLMDEVYKSARKSERVGATDYAFGLALVTVSNFNTLGYDTTIGNGHALCIAREEQEWFFIDRINGLLVSFAEATTERENTGVADFPHVRFVLL